MPVFLHLSTLKNFKKYMDLVRLISLVAAN